MGEARVQMCATCGRVQMDAATLAALTGGAVRPPAPLPTSRQPAPLPLPGYDADSGFRVPPPPVLGGASVTPAPPPHRPGSVPPSPSRGLAPPPPPLTGLAVTPGAPPRRTPSPAPARRATSPAAPAAPAQRLDAHTVVPFASAFDDGDLDGPPRGAERAKPLLRAAPPPEPARGVPENGAAELGSAVTLLEERATSVGEHRPAIDESRLPTEEALRGPVAVRPAPTAPSVGPNAGVSLVRAASEPAFGLRAAVTRHDEPDLGLDHADDADDGPVGPLLGDGDDVEDGPVRRRGVSPAVALLIGAGVGALLLGSVGAVAAIVWVPSLLAAAPPAPVTPGLAEAVTAAPLPPEPSVIPDPPEAVPPLPGAAPAAVAPEVVEPPAPKVVEPPLAKVEPPAPKVVEPPLAKVEPPVAKVVEKPAPKVVEKPPAPRPKPSGGYDGWIRQGWEVVETDPESASDIFGKALGARPSDPEASYGLGYAMLKLGQRNGAKAYLCAAANGANPSTAAEIRGILTGADLACE